MKNALLIVAFLHLVLLGFSQETSADVFVASELEYEVNTVYPSLSISKTKLEEAYTIVDLHPHYKPSWIRKFISVEISASYQGEIKKAVGKDDTLTKAQKDLMHRADIDTDIAVKMHYIPENSLTNNEPKVFDFKFIVNPDNEKINTLLLEAIQTMPCWKPAEYANGTKVKQELALTVGNHKSCVINLLNLRRDSSK